jgi:hypothetical protein
VKVKPAADELGIIEKIREVNALTPAEVEAQLARLSDPAYRAQQKAEKEARKKAVATQSRKLRKERRSKASPLRSCDALIPRHWATAKATCGAEVCSS